MDGLDCEVRYDLETDEKHQWCVMMILIGPEGIFSGVMMLRKQQKVMYTHKIIRVVES